MGVVRLTDLIGDARPALRNEALLLLVGLSRSSPDIQRLAAFEGAFDRVLTIIRWGLPAHLQALMVSAFVCVLTIIRWRLSWLLLV